MFIDEIREELDKYGIGYHVETHEPSGYTCIYVNHGDYHYPMSVKKGKKEVLKRYLRISEADDLGQVYVRDTGWCETMNLDYVIKVMILKEMTHEELYGYEEEA